MGHGEHLRILVGGRYNHGIDCGDRTVLHLALPSGGGMPVVKRSLFHDFASGAERVEVVRHAERTHPPKMVVSRAFSKLGDTAVGAMFPSAEHFVAWCLTGQAPLAHAEPVAAAASAAADAAPATQAKQPVAQAPRAAQPAAKAPGKARVLQKSKPAPKKAERPAPATRKVSKPASKKKVAAPKKAAKRKVAKASRAPAKAARGKKKAAAGRKR